MKLTTIPPAYLPSLNYFWQIAQTNHIIFTDHFQYVKRSPLTISAPLHENGLQLRLPVRHDHIPLAISHKNIDHSTTWMKKHFRSISHLFHDTPYAYYYLPQIEMLLNKATLNLSDFIYQWLNSFILWLQLPVDIQRVSEIGSKDSNEESIVFWCDKFSCREYLAESEVFRKGWVKQRLLEKRKIKCSTFAPMPEAHILTSYKDLSVLNFLLQFGPEAGYLIRQYIS